MPTTLDSMPYDIAPVTFPTIPPAFGRDGVGMDTTTAILDSAMESQARVMEWRTKMDAMKRAYSAQRQGRQAMSELSGIDPASPDYLRKRADIISRNPEAVLDRGVAGFLGLQEDIYKQAEVDENELWRRQYAEGREQRYENQAIMSEASQRQRAFQSRYQKLGNSGRGLFDRAMTELGDPMIAVEMAERTEAAEEEVRELFEEGATQEEIEAMMVNGQVDPLARAKWVGSKKNMAATKEEQRDAQKAEADYWRARMKALENEGSVLDNNPPTTMTPEQLEEARKVNASEQWEAAQKIKGLPGPGGASASITPGGQRSFVRPGGIMPSPQAEAAPEPSDKPMKQAVDRYFSKPK